MNLWNVLCDTEIFYLAANGKQRVILRHRFHEAQLDFNQAYRIAVRNYRKDKIECPFHKRYFE